MVEMQGPAEIVIVMGTSGAGRRAAAYTVEDLGWYVVDNLPLATLSILVDRMRTAERLAVVVDVYSGEESEQLPIASAEVKARGYRITVLSLGASDDVIVQCQESNRRPLPLQYGGRLFNGTVRKRWFLADLRASADIIVDTSRPSARQLAQRVPNHSGTDATDNLSAALVPFGSKNGLSVDVGTVLDVRFLPNPYWVSELRPKTGLSPDVAPYVPSQDAAQELQGRMLGVIGVAVPGYLTEGKCQVIVATGCTSGKHHSTSMTEGPAIRLCGRGYGVSVLYRDLGKE